jgi:hypothetical protein
LTASGKGFVPTTHTLLLIACRETHESRTTAQGPLRTLNVYIPLAYTRDGEELLRGQK